MAIPANIATVTVVKSGAGIGGKDFSNTYDIELQNGLRDASVKATAAALANTERLFLGTKTLIKGCRVQYARGVDPDGRKVKPLLVNVAAYGVINLDDITATNDGGLLPAQANKILPPEVCTAIAFIGGDQGQGVHTYRNSIAESHWVGEGGPVKLTQAYLDVVNHLWDEYMANNNAANPLVLISGAKGNETITRVSDVSVLGSRLRQLTQNRSSKKDQFDPDEATPEEATEPLTQAIEVLSDVNNDRYTQNGQTLLQSAKFLGALSSIAGIAALLKAAHDAGDYGPNPVGG